MMHTLFQMGLGTDFSQMENMLYGDVENDEELEAELLALQGGGPPAPSPKAPKPAARPKQQSKCSM